MIHNSITGSIVFAYSSATTDFELVSGFNYSEEENDEDIAHIG
jgi:hypothetical protein